MGDSAEVSNRKAALAALLLPIKWHPSASIPARKNIVFQHRKYVDIAYPFLNEDEQKRADAWRKAESHEGLWE